MSTRKAYDQVMSAATEPLTLIEVFRRAKELYPVASGTISTYLSEDIRAGLVEASYCRPRVGRRGGNEKQYRRKQGTCA